MLYPGDRLPAEPGRVLNGVDLGLGSAVEDGVEPVVPLEALRGFKLVGRKPDLFDRGPALDLDEPNFDGGLRILRVRLAGDEVEAAVVLLDALHLPAAGLLVGDHRSDREPLGGVVPDHRCDLRRLAFRMGQRPGPADVQECRRSCIGVLV